MRIAVPVDADEVLEACAVFDRWADRLEQLPQHLRQQVLALARAAPTAAVEAVAEGGAAVMQLTPRARALVACIRAHEGQSFP